LTRVTIDIDPKTATALSRWLAKTAPTIGAPFPAEAEVIMAMIVTCLRYADVADQVASQLRHQRAAGKERDRG
jgi:hypothetical protein